MKASPQTKALPLVIVAFFMTAPFAAAYAPDINDVLDSFTACKTAHKMPEFMALDIDRDGRIDYREMKTNEDRNGAKMFNTIDLNADGFLSRSELTAFKNAGECKK